MREAAQLRVVEQVLRLVEPPFTKRPTVLHDERGRVDDLRGFVPLEHIVELGRDGQRMFDARIAIDAVRDVELLIETTFCGGHDPQLLRRHDDPLPLLTIAAHVHLERLGVVVLGIPRENLPRMLQVAHRLGAEHARPRRVNARPDHLAVLHAIAVRQKVGGGGLRIACRGGAVCERGEILPRLRVVHVGREPLRVIVRIHHAGHEHLAGHVDNRRAVRNGYTAARAHRHNALVAHHDVGVLDDLLAPHGDGFATAQHHRARGHVALTCDHHAHLAGLVARWRLLGSIGLRNGVAARNAVLHRLRGVGAQTGLATILGLERIVDHFRAVQVVREQRVAQCPVHLASIARPRGELTANRVELLHRHRRCGRRRHTHGGRCRTDLRHRHGVDVHAHRRQRHIPVGRHDNERRRRGRRCGFHVVSIVQVHALADGARGATAESELRFFGYEGAVEIAGVGRHGARDAQMCLDVGAVPAKALEAAAEAVRKDSRRVVGEVRRAKPTRRCNHGNGAAGSGEPYQFSRGRAKERTTRFLHFARSSTQRYQSRASGRPHKIGVQPGVGREYARAPHVLDVAVGAHNVPTTRVFPRDPRERLAIGRPHGIELTGGRVRYSRRLHVGEGHDVHAIECRERERLAIGRRLHVANLARREGGCGIHLVGELHFGAQLELHFGFEGDFDGRTLVDGYTPELSAVAHDDGPRVGGEAVARIRVHGRARFHVVALHRIGEPLFLLRVEVAQHEPRLGLEARGVHEPLAIGGQRRARARTVAGAHLRHASRFLVPHRELELGTDAVVLPVTGARGEPHVPRVFPEGGAELLLIWWCGGLCGERHTAAAVHMVHPQLGRAAQSTRARRHNVLAVGGVLRRRIEIVVALGHLRAVAIGKGERPEILTARAIGDEHDRFAIGGKSRLRVVGHAAGEARGFAAGYGHGVQVAEQVEDERAAVGRDIHAHPRAFRGGERVGASGFEWQAGVGAGGSLRVGAGNRRGDGGEGERVRRGETAPLMRGHANSA